MKYKLTVDLASAACERLNEAGFEAEVRPNYSGRGMYGKTAVGIVTIAPAVLVGWAVSLAVLEAATNNSVKLLEGTDVGEEPKVYYYEQETHNDVYDFAAGELLDYMPRRSDSMGRDFCIYY